MIRVFHTKAGDDEHLYGHALARYALGREFVDSELILAPQKKPLAKAPGAYLSISHSCGVCAVAVADEPVGLDIELNEREPERLMKLAKRFFSSDEAEYVKPDPARRFYEIWCKKESYVKYTGEGFSREFPGFSVFDLNERFSSFDIYGHFGCVCAMESAGIEPVFVDSAEISRYL